MPEPLRLSDVSLLHVLHLAAPLSQLDRSRFLEDIAARLAGERELGDGLVGRVARECQAKYLRPATTADLRGVNKYERKFRNGSGGNGTGGQAA